MLLGRFGGLSEIQVTQLVQSVIEERQLGFLCEPRVNVVSLNMKLDFLTKK